MMKDEPVVISSPKTPRAGWEEGFREMGARGEDELLDAPLPSLTRWDEEEWAWRSRKSDESQ